MPNRYIVLFLALTLLAAGLIACDEIKEEVNDRTQQTKTLEMTITDDWVPLLAAEFNQYQLTSICYADPFSADILIGASDYADWWDQIKGHIKEIDIKNFYYKIGRNKVETAGGVNLYIMEDAPDPIAIPEEILEEFLDDPTLAYFVNANDLPANALVATIPVQPGQLVEDYTDIDWVDDGEEVLEEMLLEFDQPFTFCLEMDINPLQINSLDDLKAQLLTKLRFKMDIIFVPLD